MNKADLISEVSEKTNLSKKESQTLLNAILESISEALVAGDKVQLIGFGSFETRVRASRTARNPMTGETITIPSKKAPVFKASKALKESIN